MGGPYVRKCARKYSRPMRLAHFPSPQVAEVSAYSKCFERYRQLAEILEMGLRDIVQRYVDGV